MEYKERNEYYKTEYNKVVKYFSKRVDKLGLELNSDMIVLFGINKKKKIKDGKISK